MKNDLTFKKTIVVGAGAMGIGIAQVLSQAGATVFLYDIDLAGVKKALEKLEKVMERLVVKGRLERLESREILKRITPIEALEKAEGAQVVIEAISENIELKRDLFQRLEDLLPADTIFATNTSSLSIASLAKGLNHPERLIGIHFFNPAALMPLVEIIPSMATGPEIVSDCKSWLTQMGKSPVVAKDSPGFIVNRVARAFYGEAMNIYEEGIASPDTIDWALTSLGKFKMGPFLLMDFIGQDINYSVSESVWTQFYFEPRFRPNISQKRLVDQGWLGRKTGRGFYTYEEGSAVSNPIKDEALGNSILERILALLINEALSALGDRLCTLEDLETAMVKGVNYPIGLIEWAKKIGPDKILQILKDLLDHTGDGRYRPTPLLKDWVTKGKLEIK